MNFPLLVARRYLFAKRSTNAINIITGISVFGIAISFGSQTLVEDIVSGIFYLTAAAFRVGEYIDCGKAKGTVGGGMTMLMQAVHFGLANYHARNLIALYDVIGSGRQEND